MSNYSAKVIWERKEDDVFTDNKYSRAHQWLFDGGAVIDASPSPHIVPMPYSVEAFVDPEEAFVASLSSCHMLFFLHIAAEQNFIVNEYQDDAVGVMGKDEDGNMLMTNVTLRPDVKFEGDLQPTLNQLKRLHHLAHEKCFIANSVKTQVNTEIVSQEVLSS